MVQPHPAKLTPDEFLAWEREQPDKWMYVRGELFAMSGGSPRHNRLGARVLFALERGLAGGPCAVFTADQKVGLAADVFVYTDAVVVCGPIVLRPGTTDVAMNPRVVVEVLSKGTEAYDRGDKQRGYLGLPTVEHYALVSQREARVELYTRQADGSFRYDVVESGGVVHLERIGVTVPIDDLYAGVFAFPGDDAA